MKKLFLFLLCILVSSFSIVSCNKKNNNPVGASFYQNTNVGSENHIALYTSPSDTFFSHEAHTHYSTYLFTGNYKGFEAGTLIQFNLWPDSGIVSQPVLTFLIDSLYQDTDFPVELSLYSLNTSWEEDQMTWETFSETMLDQKIAEITLMSSDRDTIQFDLDSVLVNGWTDTTDTIENNGLYLKVETNDAMIQLFSRSSSSVLAPRISYSWSEDTSDTKYSSYASQDVFYVNTNPQTDPDHLYLTNGYALWSYLKFNLDTIPAKATINSAMLYLTQDTLLATPSSRDNFSFYGYKATENSNALAETDYDSTEIIIGSANDFIAKMDISEYVQSWVADSSENYGLILKGMNESSTLWQRSFYSSSAQDSTFKPRIEIYYSINPETIY